MRIDTHMHVVPPAYKAWLQGMGINAGGREIPDWSAQAALDLMGSVGASAAILSVSTPGVYVGEGEQVVQTARKMARQVNEYAAMQAQRHPGHFGFFATLTLPDMQGALEECAYAFDQLGADGVVLLASVNGIYLGDASIEPLMHELNRRGAVLFVHPSELPGPAVAGIPAFAADFLLDTTRAAINMAKAGWLERFANVKVILSHAGGFIPFAAERVARVCGEVNGLESPENQARGLARLRKFYFDTALSSSPYALPSLLAFADPSHITFGSDWPYAPAARSQHFAKLLDDYALSPAQRKAIDTENARALFKRFANRSIS